MAFAATAEDALVTPKEVIASIENLESDDLSARIEYARLESSINDRLVSRSRKEFFGPSRFASSIDITENTIGWLADYAIEFDQTSKSIAEAATLAVRNPKVAENLVAKLVNANTREAKVQITDEKVITKRINCTVDDLGGLDPKSEDFDDQFRQKAIELLTNSGYTVDPETFSLNDVSVSADGYISASVSSRFTKSFIAEAGSDAMAQPPMEDEMAADQANMQPESLSTPAASEMRAAKRKEILERFAQALPGMPAMGAPAGMGGMPAGADLTAPAGMPSGGISALTTPYAEETEDTDTDDIAEPGKKLPVGSICPACGSKDVDLSNGNGHCNSCGTDIEVSYNIVVKPSSDTEVDKGADKETEAPETPEVPGAPAMSPDMGLGAATAPAPAAPPAPPAPAAPATPGLGGAVASSLPIMVRLSYKQDPSVYIAAAQPEFDVDTARQLPVGNICPSCGNRHAKKVENNRFCYNCGEVYIPKIHKNNSDPTSVYVSIDKVV